MRILRAHKFILLTAFSTEQLFFASFLEDEEEELALSSRSLMSENKLFRPPC